MSPRYAIYHCPDGELGDWGAQWLGWDVRRGEALEAPAPHLVRRPSRYGFHGTLKAPFRLAEGLGETRLKDAVDALAGRLEPVSLRLELARIGGFLALVPREASDGLAALAEATVTRLDAFRAPLTDKELARRNPAKLSAHQAALLTRWGYPYVLDEFRFHLTLTGPLPRAEFDAVRARLEGELGARLEAPYVIGSLCLCREDDDGRFAMIERFAL